MKKKKNKVLHLSAKEMIKVENQIDSVLEKRMKIAKSVMHEIESNILHSDICISYPIDESRKNVYVYTLGMSAFKMNNGKKCELIAKLPKKAFNFNPVINNDKEINPLKGLIKDEYFYIIHDMIKISKMGPGDELPFIDGDIIQLAGEPGYTARYYALRKSKEMSSKKVDIFYLVQLSDIDTLFGCNKKVDRESRIKYLNKPISKDSCVAKSLHKMAKLGYSVKCERENNDV